MYLEILIKTFALSNSQLKYEYYANSLFIIDLSVFKQRIPTGELPPVYGKCAYLIALLFLLQMMISFDSQLPYEPNMIGL